MATVQEAMLAHRELLRRRESPRPGPPVFLESASSSEVILPLSESISRRQSWSTKPFTLSSSEIEQHKQARIERMMALQDLVADSSQIIELVRQGQHRSPDICIGRARRNDVVINDETISSLHAALESTGAAMLLVDRNSSNGTFVNQLKLNPGEPLPLASGDCIRLGQRLFYYLTGERLLLFLELRIVKHQPDFEPPAT
jgi:hypothetical protein